MKLGEESKKKDGLIHRIWYLPVEGSNIKDEWKAVKEWRYNGRKGINAVYLDKLVKCDWDDVTKFPYIFLSRSPLTFGHSQLVIQSTVTRKKMEEEDFFKCSSYIIKNAIATFRTVFGDKKIHQDKKFKNLAEMTVTKGSYIKTLILRASANEEDGKEYKVHLVPYFKSHEMICKKRYRRIHKIPRVSLDETGGLLGWLGKTEDEVDKLEAEPNPFKYRLDDIANNDLNMKELAKELRNSWPKNNKK